MLLDNFLIVLCVSLIGFVANCMRGGQLLEWTGHKTPKQIKAFESKYFFYSADGCNELICFTTVLLITLDIPLAIGVTLAMAAGARPGWRKLPGAIGGWETENLSANTILDPIIAPLKSNPMLWAWAGFCLRGAYWGACLSIPFIIHNALAANELNLNLVGQILFSKFFFATTICGALMPLCYWGAFQMAKQRSGNFYKDAGWALSEGLFGFVLWMGLGFAIAGAA